MAKRKLTLETTEGGCIIPTSHKLNKDGYFRRCWKGSWIMWHRFTWEQENGKIPEGFEVNHKCKNRACCNIEHLELLEKKDHIILTNQERYKPRKDEAKGYWESTQCKGVDLARKFGVTTSAACRWIRSWKV